MVEIGVAPLTMTSNNPLTKFLLSVPMALCSMYLEILVLDRRMLPPEKPAMILLNCMFRVLPSLFALLILLDKQAKKGVTIQARVIDLH